MRDWNGNEVNAAISKGGVIALANPYDNLLSTGITPWPPSEIVQKLYKSNHSRAFVDEQKDKSTGFLSYYSDLQSLHSEDAMTWSVFGTAAHLSSDTRNQFVYDLFQKIGIISSNVNNSEIFLWRRIPHPDTLVSGGPEIDFGIYTEDVLLLGEAKWLSSVDTAQGKNKDKSQIQLRIEFLRKYGPKLYPKTKLFVVLGVGLIDDVIDNCNGETTKCVGSTWDAICSINSHPLQKELTRYLQWKKDNSKIPKGYSMG